jgi:hypothetical protein
MLEAVLRAVNWALGSFSRPADEWAPHLTLVLFLVFRPWFQYAPPGTAAGAIATVYALSLGVGLIVPDAVSQPGLWLLIAICHCLWLWGAYGVADNHHYLEGYWVIAIALALTADAVDRSGILARSATMLVGSCFGLAALWKIVTPSFRDGSFFVQAFALDDRFLPIALWVGGLSRQNRAEFARAHRQLKGGASLLESVRVSHRLAALAKWMAWWTIGIEVCVAMAFLLPGTFGATWRLWTLSVFCATTYGLVAVPAFGVILLLLLLVSLEGSVSTGLVFSVLMFVALVPGAILFARRFANQEIQRQEV